MSNIMLLVAWVAVNIACWLICRNVLKRAAHENQEAWKTLQLTCSCLKLAKEEMDRSSKLAKGTLEELRTILDEYGGGGGETWN